MVRVPVTVDGCARVVRLIETQIARRGAGVEGDPVRIVTQYWTLDGEFVTEIDPYKPSGTEADHETPNP